MVLNLRAIIGISLSILVVPAIPTAITGQEVTHFIPTHDGRTISIQTTDLNLTPKDLGKILNEAKSKAKKKPFKKVLELVTAKAKVFVAGKSEVEEAGIKQSIEAAEKSILASDPGCWLDAWETAGKKDKYARFWGPAAYPSLGDWGDEIDSLQTGPNCWLVMWEDEGFNDTHLPIYPNTYIDNMDDVNFSDQADSMKLYNTKSPFHP